MERSGAKLFCVGDDWQSIYRFSGSEVDLFVNFETYFGEYSRTFIDKTYRNSQELLDIYLLVPMSKSSRFVDDLFSLYRQGVMGEVKRIYPKKIAGIIDAEIDPEAIKPLSCPICKVGTLVKRKGAEGKTFVSCSNYPACNYSANNLESVRKNNRCPICSNFLTKRNGKFGEFLGCMSYPYCTYSADIVIETENSDNNRHMQRERVAAYASKTASSSAKWTFEEDMELKSEFNKKMSIAQIALIHNRTQGQIYYRLKKLGLME